MGRTTRHLLAGAFAALICACTSSAGDNPATAAVTPPAVSVSSLVHVDSRRDVSALRRQLITEVFGADGLPSRLPDSVATAPNWQVLKITVGDHDSVVHFYRGGGSKLAIYHAGHLHTALVEGKETISALRSLGYDVLAVDMPPEPHSMLPLSSFLAPTAIALNHALAASNYDSVAMIGLSGGGWTTTLYAAVDPRIDLSVPVAGTLPLPLRNKNSRGDIEQQLPGLTATYPDIYLLASDDGRSQIQVFNRNDPCCFAGDIALTYRDDLARRAAMLGGSFDVHVVDNDQHTIAPEVIAATLN